MTRQHSVHRDHVIKGIMYVCIAFFLFTVMQLLAKLLTGKYHVIEIAFYRNLVATIPMTLYILKTRRYRLLMSDMPIALTFRVLIGTVGLILTFGAVQYLPLSNATVIFFTGTLLTPVMSFIFLKEHVGWHRWAAVLVGMTGVVLVARPSIELTMIGVVIALAAAFTHSCVQVVLRYMKQESAFTVTYYFVFGGTVLPGLLMPWFYNPLTPESMLILIGIGIAGGFAQYCLTKAFQRAPASLLSPFGYTALLWTTVFDIVIWHYIPGWPVFLGGGIIILSKLYIIRRERIHQSKADGEAG